MEPIIVTPKVTQEHIGKAVRVLARLAAGEPVVVRSFKYPLALGEDGTLGFLYNKRDSILAEVSFRLLVEYIARGDIEI